MNKAISLATVIAEITDAGEYAACFGWQILPINEANETFSVLLVSPRDSEKYIIEFRYDGYPAQPYLIEFIYPGTKERGARRCYPKCTDSFFHPNALICHPCSRKAYAGYNNLHGDWQIAGWQKIAGGLTSLKNILDAIYSRIADKTLYEGRMDK